MNQMTKFGIILASICFLASGVLAFTYKVTKPEIDSRAREEEKAALEMILPEADEFVDKKIDGIEYYEGYKDKKLVGYCVKTAGMGYSGYIHMMVGINPAGVIEGVEVLDQQETPAGFIPTIMWM